MMGKYLVQNFESCNLVTAYEVLKLIEDTEHGTIVIVRNNTNEGWGIECHFLHEFIEMGYKFSDEEQYNNWVNK